MKASEMTDEQINEIATLAFCEGIQPCVLPTKWAMDFCGDRNIVDKLVKWIERDWDVLQKRKFKNFLLPNCTTQVYYLLPALLATPRDIVAAALKADGRIEAE